MRLVLGLGFEIGLWGFCISHFLPSFLPLSSRLDGWISERQGTSFRSSGKGGGVKYEVDDMVGIYMGE